MSTPDLQLLRQKLDELTSRSRRFLGRWSLSRDLRLTCRDALVWLLAAPVALICVQLVLILFGRATLQWPAWIWAALSASGPVLYVVGRVAWRGARRRIDRRSSLGLFDSQLDSKDRLVTADEFLAAGVQTNAPMDRFKQAAIEDAATHVERALDTTLEPMALPAWHVSARSWASVPAAVLTILAAVWLGRVAVTGSAAASADALLSGAELETVPARLASQLDLRRTPPREDRKPPDERTDANDARPSAETSPKSARSEQDADGQSHAGGQANSRSSSQAMSSSGTPSSQQTPSKPVEEDTAQEQKRDAPTPAKKADAKKPEQQATSATSGQGQSKSSSSDTNKIPATDQPDRAGASKDDGKDEAGIQDEVEEEKTAGVERPSLRKNKPPVDRNLSPLPTGDQPSPIANGRSGPGGRKKTRGVPAMILGVPTPDRIQGMNNPGRSKVTQENSTPKEEPQAALTAEHRQAREKAFGHVEHPLLRPWMQSLIEKYFMQLREKK